MSFVADAGSCSFVSHDSTVFVSHDSTVHRTSPYKLCSADYLTDHRIKPNKLNSHATLILVLMLASLDVPGYWNNI